MRHQLRMRRGRIITTALVGVALLVGCTRDGTDGAAPRPNDPVWFEEQASERGLAFEHRSGHTGRFFLPEIMGGGAALFDMDGDGDLDAYLVQSGSLVDPGATGTGNRLFENMGDGRFRDVTEGSGADDRGYGMGVAAADHDGDGDVDLYVTNVGPNRLLRNEGGGRFSDVTGDAGVGHPGWSTSAAWLDYDRDGDLDLFVTNYVRWSVETEIDCYGPLEQPDYCSPRSYEAPAPDALYRNDGGGRFTEVSEAAGLGAGFGNGLGVVAADFDGDGWQDVFVANDGTLDQLWINQGGERFIDNALLAGCAADQEGLAKAGMGVAPADVDDDGDLDVLVCNLNHESDSFFRNDGGSFTDITSAAGLGFASRVFTRFGVGFIDFDHDGWLDLFEANGRVVRQGQPFADDPYAEPNLLLRGSSTGRFEEVPPRGGSWPTLFGTSRAAAFGDVDDDGAVDVLVVNRDASATLLMNVAAGDRDWISFRVLNEAGAPAEGAIVSLTAGDRQLRRDVRAGYSYLASCDPRAHAGLGDVTTVTEVTVRWVDGHTETFGDFDAGQVVTLRRGEGG